KIILEAFGLSETDIAPEHLRLDQATARMREGTVDAFFFVGGYPTGAISELASSAGIELVPIAGTEAKKILADFKFFGPDKVPAGTYKDVGEVETISVNALWVTSAKQPENLVYGITKAIWNDNSRKLLDAGHAKGKVIRKETALDGVGIPLHPGAAKFYKEAGLLK
ncbi:MAG: TAXI family TRAP transporter solute-binding subunit, partial [Siculibacillus sp.]|nr:TAXI family TRAP transporter solute-binding subunit [Siculibacillus sp.]